MVQTLLPRVRSRMFLHARRRTLHLLEGQYASLHRGRSMDFDELREYVAGDEVKDIDWKATARTTGLPLVKRYVAERRQRILFVVDRGRDLRALAASGEDKRDLAVMVVGVLGSLALQHGDEVGLVTGDASGVQQLPFRSSSSALEHALHAIHDHARADGPASDLPALLERVRHTIRHRLFLVVIADELAWDDRLAQLVRRLAAQHEAVWVQLADAEPHASAGVAARGYDVDGSWSMPSFLDGAELQREYEAAQHERRLAQQELLTRGAVSLARVGAEAEVVPVLLRLLKERSHVRR